MYFLWDEINLVKAWDIFESFKHSIRRLKFVSSLQSNFLSPQSKFPFYIKYQKRISWYIKCVFLIFSTTIRMAAKRIFCLVCSIAGLTEVAIMSQVFCLNMLLHMTFWCRLIRTGFTKPSPSIFKHVFLYCLVNT